MTKEIPDSSNDYVNPVGREVIGNPLFGTFIPIESLRRQPSGIPKSTQNFPEHTDESLRPTSLWGKTGKVRSGETGTGCAVGCIYCNQISLDRNGQGDKIAGYLSCGVDGGISINSRLMVGNRIDQEISIDDLIEATKQYPYYEPTSSVILENFNDPGMRWDRTINLMRRMVSELKHTGPLIFITKMGISPRYVEQIKQIQEMGGKPICIVTYSGLPKEIEPIDKKQRLRTMQQMHDAGIPVIMSMRPMIRGLNATEERIKETLRETYQNVDIYTTGGLFVYQDYTADAFVKAGYPLPPEYTEINYPVAKILPEDVRRLVRQVTLNEGIRNPVHDHTSCAISQLMTLKYNQSTPDRLAHWSGETDPKFGSYCSVFCDPKQIAVCKSKSQETPQAVVDLAKNKLTRIGYPDYEVIPSATQTGLLLVKGDNEHAGSFLIEQLFTVAENAGWYVNNLPSYEGLIHRSRQAMEEDMGLNNFDSVFVGAILVGQEWHVFIDGEIDHHGNELTVRWLRSRNRARIQVENAQQLLDHSNLGEIEKRFMEKTKMVGQLQTIEELSSQLSDLEQKMLTRYSQGLQSKSS